MKKFLIAAAAGLVALAAPALAADMAVKAPPPAPIPEWNWTGVYVGVEGGGGWGSSVQTAGGTTSTGRYDIQGWEGGGTLGFNWQVQRWVFGVETDFSGSHISGSTDVMGAYNCGTVCSTDVGPFGTLRGRLGYAWNNVLFYGTGGLAYGSIRSNLDGGVVTHQRTGWTAGAGMEYGFAPHWSAKLEWLYVDFNNYQWTNADNVFYDCTGINCRTDAKFSVIRAGVNYTFGGPVVAKY